MDSSNSNTDNQSSGRNYKLVIVGDKQAGITLQLTPIKTQSKSKVKAQRIPSGPREYEKNLKWAARRAAHKILSEKGPISICQLELPIRPSFQRNFIDMVESACQAKGKIVSCQYDDSNDQIKTLS